MPDSAPWTIGRLLGWTTDYLKERGAEHPRLDAEVLLAHARGCQRIQLYTAFNDEPSDDVKAAFRQLVKKRAEGAPVAYLVGRKEFYSLSFRVTPDVLIPRPETEFLVIELLDLIKACAKDKPREGDRGAPEEPELKTGVASLTAHREGDPGAPGEPALRVDDDQPDPLPKGEGASSKAHPALGANLRIADVGTGSGAISVAVAVHAALARLTAIDISPAALQVAAVNAGEHGVAERIEFLESDLLGAVAAEPTFDYIVSNPPYIASGELPTLPRDVRDHEPRLALAAGPLGSEIIARLIPQAAERLVDHGWLLTEISPQLEREVHNLFAADGRFEAAATVKDLAGLARLVKARKRPIGSRYP